jgi:hypothetical protein
MQSDSDIAGFLLKAIGLLAALAALYVGWEVFLYYRGWRIYEGGGSIRVGFG